MREKGGWGRRISHRYEYLAPGSGRADQSVEKQTAIANREELEATVYQQPYIPRV